MLDIKPPWSFTTEKITYRGKIQHHRSLEITVDAASLDGKVIALIVYPTDFIPNEVVPEVIRPEISKILALLGYNQETIYIKTIKR